MATPLAEGVGYDRVAAIVNEALASGRTVRQVALEKLDLPPGELDRLLDVRRMTGD